MLKASDNYKDMMTMARKLTENTGQHFVNCLQLDNIYYVTADKKNILQKYSKTECVV